MAALANTFVSTDAVGNREQLSNVVSMVDPQDKPVYSLMRKVSAKNTYPEWEVDGLATPAANAKAEGDEYTFDTVPPPERQGNSTQISNKRFLFSNTQNAIDNAGMHERTKRQRIKKGVELLRDIEYIILSNTASLKSGTRLMGGLPSWYTSNANRGGGGANGGFNTGTGLTVAATNGTQRAFTKALLDNTLETSRKNGAKPKFMVCSPYVKTVFATFMSDSNVAQFRYAANDGSTKNTIIASAEIYLGQHGKVTVIDDDVMHDAGTARNVHLLDPSNMAFAWLRKIAEDKGVAKTGDAKKTVLVGEGTLAVTNQQAHAVIADVFGLTATT